jgi:hypothetical protein
MHLSQRTNEIRRRLNGRKMVWFGTRGADAQPLLQFPELTSIFSQIAPLDAVSIATELCLETMKGVRVDLNRYSIDADSSEEAKELHRRVIKALREPSVLVAYRPCSFLASAYYPRSETCQYLGLFHERQAAFEHKPWVETELRKHGIRVIPWKYFDDEDQLGLAESLEAGPMVLRANRTDGGAGLTLVSDERQMALDRPAHYDGFLAAAPLLDPTIPLNINACVFRNGSVRLHAPSLQLVGIRACTGRRFGYCGNDFARVRDLDPKTLDAFEDMALSVGKWLAREGYVGVFGIDAVVHDGKLFLAEINARFQGSSPMAAQLVDVQGRANLFLDHLAAFLGLDPGPSMPLREQAREQPRMSQIAVHNRAPVSISRLDDARFESGDSHCKLLAAERVEIDPEGLLFKLVVGDAVTDDGLALRPEANADVRSMTSQLFGVGPGYVGPTASVGTPR